MCRVKCTTSANDAIDLQEKPKFGSGFFEEKPGPNCTTNQTRNDGAFCAVK